MKNIIVILIVMVFIIISGCQKKVASDKDTSQTNDVITDLIKEDILSSSTNTNIMINTNVNITEAIQKTNQAAGLTTVLTNNKETASKEITNAKTSANLKKEKQKDIPLEPEVGAGKINNEIVENKKINDEAIKIPEKTMTKTPIKQKPVKLTKLDNFVNGSFIKVGDDTIGQEASPRKNIKVTCAVVSELKDARYVDFSIYAIPKGKDIKLDSEYLISKVRNIEVINNQSQLTKYWNGKNVDKSFLHQGKYNIYLVFSIKDSKMNVLKKDSRYWGSSDKYYIKLY